MAGIPKVWDNTIILRKVMGMLEAKWHIILLNGLHACLGEQSVERFRTQKTGELLAFLALNTHRYVPREEIAGVLWPDNTLEAGRASLRTALASLRQQMEPPGILANSVLLADRVSIRLCPDAVCTDVSDFEAACRQADNAPDPEQRLRAGLQATHLYAGDLLPGYYAEWILEERARLAQSYRHLLRRLVATLRAGQQSESALLYARLLLAAEPYEDEIRLLTMRLHAEAGQREEALRCYEDWKRLLQDEFHTCPPQEADLLAEQIQQMPVRELLPFATTKTVGLQTGNSSQLADAPCEITSSQEALPPSTIAALASPPPAARLPLPLSRFFGRETEIMQVARLLAPSLGEWRSSDAAPPLRLVTLSGPGGTGKTRLAIEIGRQLHEQAGLPVTFVPLADLSEPSRVPEAIASALMLSPVASSALLDEIVAELSKCSQLLLLDNCEHLLAVPEGSEAEAQNSRSKLFTDKDQVVSGLVPIIQTLLERAPNLQLLITSRQCLGLEGEQEFSTPPLPTPIHAGTPERLLEFASVKLFVNRAQLSRPDFQLTPRNADVVGSLCAQLEGLPLALELAAAWVSTLSPTQIRERLTQRFDLLVGRRTGGVSRHRSLRAALEWSYQLLSPELQRFFTHLAVFRGGWTLEAAQYVCARPDAAECLRALRDRSLILVEENEDEEPASTRFRLLETLREFAEEQLAPEEQTTLRRRHLHWCLKAAEAANPHLVGASQALWLRRLTEERENAREALKWRFADEPSVLEGIQLVVSLLQFWCLRGNFAEIRAIIERLLSHSCAQEPTVLRTRGLNLAAQIARYQGDLSSAVRYGEEALHIAQRLGEPFRIAQSLLNLGTFVFTQGDLDRAHPLFEASLHYYHETGNTLGVAAVYGGLSCVAEARGELAEAIQYCRRALEVQQQQQNLSGITHYLKGLGCLYVKMGEGERARDCLGKSLDGYCELGDLRGLAHFLWDILTLLPLSLASVRLLGAAQALNATTQAAPFPITQIVEPARGLLGAEAVEAAWAAGRELTVAQTVQEARLLLKQEFVHSPVGL